MKLFSSESKFGLSAIGFMLIISILGLFVTLYNALIAAEAGLSFWAVVFMLLALTAATGLIWQLQSISSKSISKQIEINSMKESVRLTQKKEEKEAEEEKNKEAVEEEKVDIEAEAQEIIPQDDSLQLEILAEEFLKNTSKKHEVVQGVLFHKGTQTEEFTFLSGYAFYSQEEPQKFKEGETLPGQVAKSKETLVLDKVPKDYITVVSGLGEGTPNHLLITPVLNAEGECIATIELASFKSFKPNTISIFERATQLLSERITTIANSSQE